MCRQRILVLMLGVSAKAMPLFDAAAAWVSEDLTQDVIIRIATKRRAARGCDALLLASECACLAPTHIPVEIISIAGLPTNQQYNIVRNALKKVCLKFLAKELATVN